MVQNTQKEVTLVITSCNRHELLKETLESFINFNTYPITKTIIIEDSSAEKPAFMFEKFFSEGLGNVTWIDNGKNKGQIYSIDRAYSEVETEYIFHCEDDWKFTRTGFIEQSLEILEKYPEVFQVWMRDDSAHPIVKSEKYPFPIIHPNWNGWCGFSFNPGLRRLQDWKNIGSYGRYVGYDPRSVDELALSKLHQDMGFVAAKIRKAVEHIGHGKHVDFTKAKKPLKVLIAIPACHKYEYKNHVDGRIHKNGYSNKRVEAVRNTWQKYMPAFKSYVDMKFFYGQTNDSSRAPLEDEIFLEVADDYNSLPKKVQAIFKYALANGYDYVFKGDDDTFIYVDRLMSSGFEDYDYLGYAPDDPKVPEANRYASGGSGYWVSRKAMEVLTNTFVHNEEWAEDAWVGARLFAAGIKVTRDARYLPGFWEHFVDVDALPADHSYISMHACTPEMMDKLYKKTLSSSFKKIKRAFHEDVTYGAHEPRQLEYDFEFEELLELTLIQDMPDLNKDLKNKVNQSIELLAKKITEIKKTQDIILNRLDAFNQKSSHKI